MSPKNKKVLLVVGAVFGVSCCGLIGPWVLIGIMFAVEDYNKDRAARQFVPMTLAEAVDRRYSTPEEVATFIDRGADVNERVPGANGATRPLIAMAAEHPNVEVVRLLIKRGANVNEAGLWSRVRASHEDMARMLIEQGASLGPQPDADLDIGPELIQAAAFGHQAWLVPMLVAKGADVHIVNKNGDRLLILSLYTESMDPGPESNSAGTTKALLAAGADPNAAGRGGYTPLHWAAHHGKVEEIRMLLAAGAALEAQSDEKATPLAVAVERCQPEAVALLLSSKASRTVLTPRGLPLSEGACAYGYPAVNKPNREKIEALLSRPPA